MPIRVTRSQFSFKKLTAVVRSSFSKCPSERNSPSDCPAPEKSKQKRLIPAGRSTGSRGSASTREPALPWQNTTQGNGRERGRKRAPGTGPVASRNTPSSSVSSSSAG